MSHAAEARPAATTAPESLSTPRWYEDYLTLAKVRVNLMVVMTTAVGFLIASASDVAWLTLLDAIVGTGLVAGGAAALNQVLERRTDAAMRRTARRPLPAGRLSREHALRFGVGLAIAGMAYLAMRVNLLTAVLGAATLFLYAFVYTPLKRVTSVATIVGAVPGAIPPMMGVSAATGNVDLMAWALFGILFLWQMPHFLAIAWLYRDDYARGGFPMLPVRDQVGDVTARQMALYTAALIPVSLLPNALGVSGPLYLFGAFAAGLAFLAACFVFAKDRGAVATRRLVLVSVAYLPVVLVLMVADRGLF